MKTYTYKLIFLSLSFLNFSLGADTNKYKQAYEMESKSTLFAIPLYEQSIQSSNSKSLQKAAVTRLFYLYKKHNKVIEALLLGTRYSSIVSSKDKSGIWKSVSEIYKPLTYTQLTNAYTVAIRTNSENYLELINIIRESKEPKLFEFVFIILYKRKQFELLNQIFNEDHSISSSPLYQGIISIKLNAEKGKEYLNSIGHEMEKDDATSSDLLYLMGQYYRALGEFAMSARYFRMSSSYHWQERGKIESAKSLVLGGNFGEVCQTFNFSSSPNEEVSQIFYLICNKKDKRDIK